MSEWAIEADPGRLTASFPTFPSYEAARWAADLPCMYREGLPMPRVVVRVEGGEWRLADAEQAAA